MQDLACGGVYGLLTALNLWDLRHVGDELYRCSFGVSGPPPQYKPGSCARIVFAECTYSGQDSLHTINPKLKALSAEPKTISPTA